MSNQPWLLSVQYDKYLPKQAGVSGCQSTVGAGQTFYTLSNILHYFLSRTCHSLPNICQCLSVNCYYVSVVSPSRSKTCRSLSFICHLLPKAHHCLPVTFVYMSVNLLTLGHRHFAFCQSHVNLSWVMCMSSVSLCQIPVAVCHNSVTTCQTTIALSHIELAIYIYIYIYIYI